ncbi:MAG: hypothetical protein NZM11_11965, partial [Anaerolineales bacterium]|nr:hypothetical protein [Anaerolineales bacterium]
HAALNNSLGGVVVADRLEVNNSRTVLLLAREFDGTVYTLLDARGAALFGLLAGAALGLVWLLGGMMSRRNSS